MSDELYHRASRTAELAIKADSEGRLVDAERYYKEASQCLIEYCKGDKSKLSQMARHINNYLDRVTDIQSQLAQSTGTASQTNHQIDHQAAETYNGPDIDSNAQAQLETMGLTSLQARDALRRFDNNVERAATWFFDNPQPDPDPGPSAPPIIPPKPASLPQASSSSSSSSNPFSTLTANTANPSPALPPRSKSPPPRSIPSNTSVPRNLPGAVPPSTPPHRPAPPSRPIAKPPSHSPVSSKPFQPPPPPPPPPSSTSTAPIIPPRPPQPSLQVAQPSQPNPPRSTQPPHSGQSGQPPLVGKKSAVFLELLRAANVSETATCRCVMFANERGAKCGMPAALVIGGEGEPEAGDLCWSCKYMEAVSGIDAIIGTSDDDDEEEDTPTTVRPPVQQSNTSVVGESSLRDNTASIILPVPAPEQPKEEEAQGWFSGWLTGGTRKDKAPIRGSLSREDREELENEFKTLKSIKQNNGMSESQKTRFRKVRRSLRTNEIIEIENENDSLSSHLASSPSSSRSPRNSITRQHQGGGGGRGGGDISDDQKAERLKKVLRNARVSETAKCQCSLYSVKPGELCLKPAALAIDPETNQATATLLCWQCKRIEAYGM